MPAVNKRVPNNDFHYSANNKKIYQQLLLFSRKIQSQIIVINVQSPSYQKLKKHLKKLTYKKKRLYAFFNNNNIICDLQFGFRQQYSTSHALLNITENIRKPFYSGNIACGVFVDLQKASDTVDQQILLTKLNHCGIRGVSNDWFKFYLSNRSQYVSMVLSLVLLL